MGPWEDGPLDFPKHSQFERNSQTETVGEGSGVSTKGAHGGEISDVWDQHVSICSARYSPTPGQVSNEKRAPSYLGYIEMIIYTRQLNGDFSDPY